MEELGGGATCVYMYDDMFRQLAATDESIDWSRLSLSLYTTTFLNQQGGGSKMCHLCLGGDHGSEECAQAPLQPKLLKPIGAESKEEKGTSQSGRKPAKKDPRHAAGKTKHVTFGTRGDASSHIAIIGMCA